MDNTTQERRLQVLAGQLATNVDSVDVLSRSATSAADVSVLSDPHSSEEPYAIALPEHLTPEGPWHVYRCL